MKLKSLILLGMLLCSIGAQARESGTVTAERTTLPSTASILEGKLPNGMAYFIAQNDRPQGSVSIRFFLKIGSYQETDAERGAAHFIEHLAFRSSSSFPNEMPHRFFEPLGVSFGSDLNAFTGLNLTQYRLDLPPAAVPQLDRALSWMRGIGDGISFAPDMVEAERGVVRAELQQNRSFAKIAETTISNFQSPTMRSFNRDPAGTAASITALNPAKLQNFYQRWYRPENAALVIVGPMEPGKVKQMIEAAFATWTGVGSAGTVPPVANGPEFRGIEAFTHAAPGLMTSASSCRIAAIDTPDVLPAERKRRELLTRVWTAILNERFSKLQLDPAKKILGASVISNNTLLDAKVTCLIIVPNEGAWQAAMGSAQAEFKRLASMPPTPLEIETVLEQMRSMLRGAIDAHASRNSASLADSLMSAASEGRGYFEPRQELRNFNIAADGLTPQLVLERLRADWAGDGPLIAAMGSSTPSKAELVSNWQAVEGGAALADYKDEVTKPWPYTDFGATGRVAKRQEFADPSFTRITFANGTILNFKKTDFDASNVNIDVRLGWGRQELPTGSGSYIASVLGTQLFQAGGLKRFSMQDLRRAFGTSSWKFDASTLNQSFGLSMYSSMEALIQDMQILTAYLQEPAFDDYLDSKLPTAIDYVYRAVKTEPSSSALNALSQQLFPNGLNALPPQEKLGAVKSADFDRTLRPVFTLSPIEVTVVGDLSESDAVAAVASSMGAIARRTRTAPTQAPGAFDIFPATNPSPIRVQHDGPATQAAAVLVWPLYVATPERRKEEYAINILGQILNDRILDKLRIKLGKTYAPQVVTQLEDSADQGTLTCTLNADPKDIDELVKLAQEVANELIAGQIQQSELDAARAPLLAKRTRLERDNKFWTAILVVSSRSSDAIEDYRRFAPLMQGTTLEDIKQAAAKWLARGPIVSIAVPKAEVLK
jgi:zinc protease